MYRVFFHYNGANAHIDTDSYGHAVSMAYGEVYARMYADLPTTLYQYHSLVILAVP